MNRLALSGPWVSPAGALTILASLALGCACAEWARGDLHPALAGLMICTCVAFIGEMGRRQAVAERVAAELCEGASPKHRPIMTSLALLAARLETMTQRSLNTHPTTNLPTREALVEQISQDVGGERPPQLLTAIRFCDFDRLAAFDHDRAVNALRAFAVRLVTATRPIHLVAQIDRDCFCIYFRTYEDQAKARAEFAAIVYVVGQEIGDESGVITPTLEISAMAMPSDGSNASQILLRLITSLARPLARQSISHTDAVPLVPQISVDASRDAFMLEQDLARAISEEQLTMVFQPVVDLTTGRMVAAEALLRWEHPTLGFVSPARFIPIVEAIGMSERYGLWVLNAACQQARIWLDLGMVDVKVAVNLSALQLTDPELNEKIERTLDRHDLEHKYLELELTETATMADADRTRQLFGELRAKGITLAIDDFGSGYSSLSYLKNLPFDKLKIDREFIHHVQERKDSQAICKALIALGRGLDLKVLAEGVETDEELNMLYSLGVRVFQGYYFSKPLCAEAFIELAFSHQWASRLQRLVRPNSIAEAA